MKRSSIWTVLEYLWYPLLVFLTTPFFLSVLGAQMYGAWMFLLAAAAFGTILSVGTGAAVIKEISGARTMGRGVRDGKLEPVIGGAMALAGIGGGLLGLATGVFLCVLGPDLCSKIGSREVLILIGFMAPLLALVDQFDNVFASALKGLEQFQVCTKIEVSARSLQVMLCMIAAYAGAELKYLAAAMLAGAVLRMLLRAAALKRQVEVRLFAPSLQGAGMMLGYSSWGWLHGIGSALFSVADRLVVGAIFGSAGLAAYTIATQLASQIHSVTAAAGSVVFPETSRRWMTKGMREAMRGALAGFRRSAAMSSVLALGLLLFGRQILQLWLGPQAAAPVGQILPYLAVAYWVLALSVIPHYTILGMGNFRLIACLNLIAGLVSIGTMLALGDAYGFTGPAASRILYGLVIGCQIYTFFDLSKKAHDDHRRQDNRESQV